jgi:phosphatidylinositol-3,4,5-trisphosphate 3-phosphatase/dual-specificity protein phosphatase PTEN
MASAFFRGKVSKKKKRFKEDGFDLDLSYITDRIIAMGFPSEGAEAVYRNPIEEVQRFFQQRHAHKFKIYNVCSERSYDHAKFEQIENGGLVCHDFKWDDHNPPALETIGPMCDNMADFLATDPQNVVAIHCKAGKGRTGCIISCLLVRLQQGGVETPNEALRKFAIMRTHNQKGVTIPSQMRYVHYYGKQLEEGRTRPAQMLSLKHVRLVTVPTFDSVALQGGGCDPYFHIKVRKDRTGKMIKIFDYKKKHTLKHIKAKERKADISCTGSNPPPPLIGDIKMIFYDYDSYSSDDKMFHLWFNTAYVENNYLRFTKAVVDKACKDSKCKHFSNNFEIELFFDSVDPELSATQTYIDVGGSDNDDDTDEEAIILEEQEHSGGEAKA